MNQIEDEKECDYENNLKCVIIGGNRGGHRLLGRANQQPRRHE